MGRRSLIEAAVLRAAAWASALLLLLWPITLPVGVVAASVHPDTAPAVLPVSATSTPPPTPVPPNGSPSPFPTALATPEPGLTPPSLVSGSAILEDLDTGQVLYAKAADKRRPVASLTKVMTAMLVLSEARPSEIVTVSGTAAGQGGAELGLLVSERIRVRELLYAILLQSSNDAAVALAEHVSGSVDRFVALMNLRAEEIGLRNTRFYSPSGLDDRGYSTARDMAVMTRLAFADPLFTRIVGTRFHTVPAPSGTPRRIQNRNILLWLYPGATGVKTGFTTPAGHCLAAAAEQIGLRFVAITLGAGGPDAEGAFNDGAALLNYGFAAFRLTTLVRLGESLGSFDIEGQPVPLVAASELVRLVRTDLLSTVEWAFRPREELALPVQAGQELGVQVLEVNGRRVGSVKVLAGESVSRPSPPAATPSEPDAAHPLDRALRLLHALIQSVIGPFL